jgi:hypothetical protein
MREMVLPEPQNRGVFVARGDRLWLGVEHFDLQTMLQQARNPFAAPHPHFGRHIPGCARKLVESPAAKA